LKEKNVRIVDVRTKGEAKAGMLKGAEVLPLNEILSKVQSGEFSKKEDETIIYCRTGSRAKIALSVLLKEGYSKLSLINGGFADL
jgi:hydroxyacylglutathione hydrolase